PMDVTQYGGEGFAYKIEYKNTSSSVWMDKIVPEGQSSTTVTDTKIYQEFQIKVTAINDFGDGPEPQVIIGYSGEGTPQAAPGNVNVNVTSPNSALVTFDPVPAESLQGKLKYYRVYYTESAAQVSGSLESVECVKPSCEVSNLKPSTDYELYVVVANGKKEGPASERQRFSTPEAPPGQPLNFEIVMLSKKMKLFWAPATRGGEVDTYQVKYSPKINEVPGNYTTVDLGPTQVDCVIEGLTPETIYIVTIKGYNTAGFGEQDLIEEATRKSGIPSVPEGVKVQPGKDEAVISWSDDPIGP
ncbi:neural cell adhesion molecule L1.1-like, partial [Anneissia japonica]|uniref:neural cell adhesion molecule L1.1-like n=1 Tax=Anneissia japonica TaxID=1529436 RepID=UPI001425541E